MAKRRVGVLEIHESPERSSPECFCGRAAADYLVAMKQARRIGKRLIQMVSGKAMFAIEEAKRYVERSLGIARPVYADGRIHGVIWQPRMSGYFLVLQARVCRSA